MGLTLDDLRQPGFGGRVWGYDRDEVDQLLASVVVSIERLQRRRQRDGEAIERATNEGRRATERAKRIERERDELAGRVELADEAVADAARRAERLVAEAEARAERAEEARRVAEAKLSSLAALGATEPGQGQAAPPITLGDEHDPARQLPLALRAARVLLADARARAATIEADAERRTGRAGAGPGGNPGDQSNRSGSSATIHS